MKKIASILFFSLVLLGSVSAQTVQKYYVYFDVDKHAIKQDGVSELDKIVSIYNTNFVQEIKLTAHTDFDASDSYNKALSQRRANSVAGYLQANSIKRSVLNAEWFGEQIPAADNATNTGKQLNRRVEIEVKYKPFSSADEIVQVARDEEQYFTIPNNQSFLITARNGSEVTIPKDAFVDKNGRPVNNKNVEISIDEALSAKDGLLQMLTTQTTDGEMLESGGMIKINASLNNEPLQLREGKQVKVSLPSETMVDDMSVFTGQRDADGVMKWEITKEKFATSNQDVKGRPLQVDTMLLMAYFNPIPAKKKLDVSQFAMEFPTSPSLPRKPREPRLPIKKDASKMNWGIQALFLSETKKQEIIDEDYAEKMKAYDLEVTKYDNRMLNYEKGMAAYDAALKAYENEANNYEQAIEEHIKMLETEYLYHKKVYDQTRLNVAIRVFCRDMRNGTLTTIDPIAYIRRYAQFQIQDEDVSKMKYILSQIRYYELLASFDAKFIEDNFVEKGRIRISKMKKFWKNNKDYSIYKQYNLYTNDLVTAILEDEGLVAKMDDAVRVKMSKDKLDGITPQETLENYYSASLNQLGWINCDKFSGIRRKVTTSILTAGVIGERVFVFIKRFRSMMSANFGEGSFSIDIPPREKAKAISIAAVNGKPQLSIVDFESKDQARIMPDYKEVTIEEMQEALAAL